MDKVNEKEKQEMYYMMEIYDDQEQYKLSLQGEKNISSITLTLDDKDKALAIIETLLSAGKVVAAWSMDTPF